MDGGKLQWTKAILCLTKQRATFLWHGVHSLWGHESMLPYCHCFIHLPEREKKYLKEWEANFKRLPLQLINQHGLSGSCCKVQVDHHSRYHRYKKVPIHHSLFIAISVQPAFYQTASTVIVASIHSHFHPASFHHHFSPAIVTLPLYTTISIQLDSISNLAQAAHGNVTISTQPAFQAEHTRHPADHLVVWLI